MGYLPYQLVQEVDEEPFLPCWILPLKESWHFEVWKSCSKNRLKDSQILRSCKCFHIESGRVMVACSLYIHVLYFNMFILCVCIYIYMLYIFYCCTVWRYAHGKFIYIYVSDILYIVRCILAFVRSFRWLNAVSYSWWRVDGSEKSKRFLLT